MKPIAWYDPTNGVVSADKDSPLFTPLGQVWGLYLKQEGEIMTEWTPEEDDAFNEVEKHSNLGKQILQDIEGQPYHFDLYVSPMQRNVVLEEVAKELEKMKAFGPDTTGSFAVYIRSMKT